MNKLTFAITSIHVVLNAHAFFIVLENSSKLADYARSAGCTIIHAPFNFHKGHKEISATPYVILSGVKQGAAVTNGQWASVFILDCLPNPGDSVFNAKS